MKMLTDEIDGLMTTVATSLSPFDRGADNDAVASHYFSLPSGYGYPAAAGSSSAHLSLSRMRRTVNDIVIPVIFSLGIVGNVLNAVLMTRRRERGPSSAKKSTKKRRSEIVAGGCMVPDARSPTVFERSAAAGLLALTASDLAFCLCGFVRVLFVGVPPDWRQWTIVGMYVAAYRGALLNLFLFTSTWMIALISVERYLAVCHPFRASVLIRVRRTIAAHVVVVAVSILVNVPLFLRNTVSTACSQLAPNGAPTSSAAGVPLFLRNTVSTACNPPVTVSTVPDFPMPPTASSLPLNSSLLASLNASAFNSSYFGAASNRSTSSSGGGGGGCAEYYFVSTSEVSKKLPAVLYVHRILYFTFGTFLPVLVIAYCNVCLIREVYAIRRHSSASSGTTSAVAAVKAAGAVNGRCRPPTVRAPMSRGSSTASSSSPGSTPGAVDRAVTLRLTMTLIAIVVCFVLLVCPSMLVQFAWFTIAGASTTGTAGGNSSSSGGALPPPYTTPVTHQIPFQTALIVTDLMQAVKFSSNFLLYCVVSRSFRRTFGKLVRIQKCRQRYAGGGSDALVSRAAAAAAAGGGGGVVNMSLIQQHNNHKVVDVDKPEN